MIGIGTVKRVIALTGLRRDEKRNPDKPLTGIASPSPPSHGAGTPGQRTHTAARRRSGAGTRALLDGMDVSTLARLRDRAFLGVLV